jgi:hypothetical protein
MIPVQVYLGKTKPSKNNIRSIKNASQRLLDTPKPRGGFWTSSIKKTNGKIYSEWVSHRLKTNWTIGEHENICFTA